MSADILISGIKAVGQFVSPDKRLGSQQVEVSKVAPAKVTLGIFWQHLKKYKRSLLVLLSLQPLVIVIQSGALPLLYSRVIDQLASETISQSALRQLFFLFLGLHFLVFVGQRVLSFASSNLELKVIRDIEQRIFNWLLRQSHDFHANKFGGALVAQAKRFTGAYSNFYMTVYFNIFSLIFRFLVAIVFLIFLAAPIALLLAVWSVVYLTIIIRLTHKKAHMSRAAAAADSHVTAQLADTITNSTVVRMFGQEQKETDRYAEMSADKYFKRRRDWRYSEVIIATQSLLMIVLEALVLYYSITLVLNGTFTIGRLALIQFFLGPILISLWDIGKVVRSVESSLADAGEMSQILSHRPDIADPEKPREVRISSGEIVFQNLSFQYQEPSAKPRPIFQDFNLHIRPGEKIGLVGHSGSGKSTLSKLLVRFMESTGGRILIDGQDIKDIRQRDLRNKIAFVPQEPLLFHRSVIENIRYGKEDATEDEVVAAAKQAYAHDFIMRLSEGYETTVGERGSKLSGGERQRIAIARAILKDTPIVVLDEATSALDTESEKLIQEALWKLMKNRTAIIIAHRLSTIQQVDRIIVLEHGKIIEQGSHEELLRKKGTYAKLWRHQSGDFFEA